MMQNLLTGSKSSDLKSQNISAILLTLLRNDDISRVNLAAALGVSNATITNLIGELTSQGYVVETGILPNNGQVGRPQRSLQLVPNSRFVIGVHVDVGTIYVALCNLKGEITERESFNHDLHEDSAIILEKIVEKIQMLVSKNKVEHLILGIGLAASGLVDVEHGINVYSPNLNWHNVEIRKKIQEHLPYSVFVDNNVRAMAFGEAYFGAGQDAQSLAFLYARIGVGAGFVVNGQLYRGGGAGAGEIGHAMFAFADGEALPLEALISEPVVLREAKKLTGEDFSFKELVERCRDGNEALSEMLKRRAFYLGLAAANLVNIMNPEVMILGGMVRHAEEIMLPVVEDTIQRYAFHDLGKRVQLQIPTFGRDAGMVGAATLALDAFFYRATVQTREAQS